MQEKLIWKLDLVHQTESRNRQAKGPAHFWHNWPNFPLQIYTNTPSLHNAYMPYPLGLDKFLRVTLLPYLHYIIFEHPFSFVKYLNKP